MSRDRLRRSMIATALVIASATAVGCGGDGAIASGNEPAAQPPAKDPDPITDPEDDDPGEGADPSVDGTEGGEGSGDVVPTDAGTSDAASSNAASDSSSDDSAVPTAPASQKLAIESARQLSAMKITAYEHTTTVDEATGTFKYDCSGFVGYALGRVLPTQLGAVRSYNGVTRPLAKHYQTFFASIAAGTVKGGWSRVVRAADVKAGDVVAWLKPADLVSTNTGHVMIARGPAVQSSKRADEILVPITDSTASPHGTADSRSPDGDGLGTGTIGLIVDSSGKPLRYRWTGGYSTQEWTTEISLGRPE